MKKVILFCTAALTLMATSCKKKETTKEETVTTTKNGYQISAKGSEVRWTGYKFTEKKGVSGKFKTINVTKAPVGTTALEAFNGVEFSIPVSSVFSDNAIRDGKLKSLFFGFMDNTEFLTGTFTTKGSDIVLNLKMNDQTKEIPLKYSIEDRHVKLEGTLNILDFGALKAYNSIHKACEALHTGTDGISKTWEDVAIEALIFLKKG